MSILTGRVHRAGVSAGEFCGSAGEGRHYRRRLVQAILPFASGIGVDGDAAAKDQLRFTLKDGALGILRKEGSWSRDKQYGIQEQVQTDRPAGIRAAWLALARRLGDPHAAEHAMMEALGEALWEAQRFGTAPDEAKYLARVQALAGIGPGPFPGSAGPRA